MKSLFSHFLFKNIISYRKLQQQIHLHELYKMDQKSIETEIQKNLVYQGMLKKRSKFLKQWRERWVVLTSNFLFTFTNKKRQEMTDVLEIKEIQGIKSYMRKSDDMTPAGFKVESSENTLILMAKDKEEKWAWIVTLERLLDFRLSKSTSECKSVEDVKNKGFKSLNEYQKANQQKVEIQEQKQETKQPQSQNLQNIIKMIQLFKSQEQQNYHLLTQCKELLKKIVENSPQSEQNKQFNNKFSELSQSLESPVIQGMIKGILVTKKVEKENESSKQLLKIVEMLMKDCKSEKVGNWAVQLKQQL